MRCRVGGGNDAAAMRVLRRDEGLPWLCLFIVGSRGASERPVSFSAPAVSYLLGVARNRIG